VRSVPQASSWSWFTQMSRAQTLAQLDLRHQFNRRRAVWATARMPETAHCSLRERNARPQNGGLCKCKRPAGVIPSRSGRPAVGPMLGRRDYDTRFGTTRAAACGGPALIGPGAPIFEYPHAALLSA